MHEGIEQQCDRPPPFSTQMLNVARFSAPLRSRENVSILIEYVPAVYLPDHRLQFLRHAVRQDDIAPVPEPVQVLLHGKLHVLPLDGGLVHRHMVRRPWATS